MKTKSDTAQRQAARKFVEYWTFQRGSEKGEDQQFWNSLLGEVLGMDDVKSHVQYQVPVPMKGTTKFLDAWIPETRVLIEHKSRGVNLDAPQAGHGGLTPYDQAAEYDAARPFDEKARWIVTCNFDEFRIYDRAKPLAPPLTLKLGNLPKEAYRLAFLVNPKEKAIDRELEISVQAGRIVGEIYDALLEQYDNVHVEHVDHVELATPPQSSTRSTCSTRINESCLAALNRLCVRLVFCLYAEDADIFPKDCFRRLIEATPAPFLVSPRKAHSPFPDARHADRQAQPLSRHRTLRFPLHQRRTVPQCSRKRHSPNYGRPPPAPHRRIAVRLARNHANHLWSAL